MKMRVMGWAMLVAGIAAVAAGAAWADEEEAGSGRILRSAGPRIGLVVATGKAIKAELKRRDASPINTAFGWQFEYEYLNSGAGTTGLIEFVPAVVGLESSLAIPSLTMLIGVRLGNGFEMGFGPNLSAIAKDRDPLAAPDDPAKMAAGIGMSAAVGMTMRSGKMNFPANLVAIRNKNGYRAALMLGWTL